MLTSSSVSASPIHSNWNSCNDWENFCTATERSATKKTRFEQRKCTQSDVSPAEQFNRTTMVHNISWAMTWHTLKLTKSRNQTKIKATWVKGISSFQHNLIGACIKRQMHNLHTMLRVNELSFGVLYISVMYVQCSSQSSRVCGKDLSWKC